MFYLVGIHDNQGNNGNIPQAQKVKTEKVVIKLANVWFYTLFSDKVKWDLTLTFSSAEIWGRKTADQRSSLGVKALYSKWADKYKASAGHPERR